MKLLLIGIALAAVAAVLIVRMLRKRAAKKVVPAPVKVVEHKPVFGPYTPGHDPDDDKYWKRYY